MQALQAEQHPQRRRQGVGGPAREGAHTAKHHQTGPAQASPKGAAKPEEHHLGPDADAPQDADQTRRNAMPRPVDRREGVIERVGTLNQAAGENEQKHCRIAQECKTAAQSLGQRKGFPRFSHRLGRQDQTGAQPHA